MLFIKHTENPPVADAIAEVIIQHLYQPPVAGDIPEVQLADLVPTTAPAKSKLAKVLDPKGVLLPNICIAVAVSDLA